MPGCTQSAPNASPEVIAAVSHRNAGPPRLTLLTMLNNRTDAGAHTSLVIAASETVLFDPAGSFRARGVPERNDVLFGFSPRVEAAYISAHARSTHRVVEQRLVVTAAQADRAYRLALAAGPVPGALCTKATADLLRKVPGFETLRSGFYPQTLMADFGELPGVQTFLHRESDDPSLEAALVLLN